MTPIEIFMVGWGACFGWGLIAWAVGFVKAIITGGHNE